MKKFRKIWKIILLDTLGVLLILAAPLLGWLPGPGGIPLVLAGLGLLSIHHEWARRWLESLKKQGASLSGKLFADNPKWRLFLDTLSIVLTVSGIWLITTVSRSFLKALAIGVIFLGLALFLGNRHRLSRMLNRFKTQAK